MGVGRGVYWLEVRREENKIKRCFRIPIFLMVEGKCFSLFNSMSGEIITKTGKNQKVASLEGTNTN